MREEGRKERSHRRLRDEVMVRVWPLEWGMANGDGFECRKTPLKWVETENM